MNNRSAVMMAVQEPSALASDNFQVIYDFWRTAKAAHELPPISAISAQKIPRALLGDCSIMSIEDGPKRFFIRLVGTRIVQELGIDLTNSWGDDRENASDIYSACIQCVEDRVPLYTDMSTAWAGNQYKRAKTLLLPYAGADNAVRRILSYSQFSYQHAGLAL